MGRGGNQNPAGYNRGSADSNEEAKNRRQQQRNAASENFRMAGAQSLIQAMKQQNMDRAVIVTAIDPNAGTDAVVDKQGGVYGMIGGGGSQQ